ncbi:hypothetical protein CFII64_12363 [Pseudomonas sp. CFII64]|nr:hypothetical protein CFII64_12363 [Pseudomonas sp. CFII64]
MLSCRVNRQDVGLAALARDGPLRRPCKSMSNYGYAEPKRGTKWWGMSLLLTFGLFKSEAL